MKGKLFNSLLTFAVSAVLAVSIVPVQAEQKTSDSSSAAGTASGSQMYTGIVADVQYHQDKARDMLAFVNDFRTSGDAWVWNEDGTTTTGIKKDRLEYDYGLEQIAMERAAEIAVSFDHTRPDGTPFYTCTAEEEALSYSENIEAGSTSASTAFEQLKEENADYSGQGHRRAMLGNYEAVGIGCVDVNGVYYWVMEFGDQTDTPETAADTSKRDVEIDVAASMVEIGFYANATEINVTVGKTIEIPQTFYLVYLNNAWSNEYVEITDGIYYTVSNSRKAEVKNDDELTGLSEGDTVLTGHLGSSTFAINLHVIADGSHAMYRMYNNNSGEHFYTADETERDHLVSVGWKYEKIGWYAPNASETPVYRMYNKNGGEHHYTMSVEERNNLILNGWNYEGIGWYSDDAKTVPLYRQYNPNASANNHNYTSDTKERDHLSAVGWNDEGVGWYGVENAVEPEKTAEPAASASSAADAN